MPVYLCVCLSVSLSYVYRFTLSPSLLPGSARDEDGGLLLSAGNIPSLDAVLAEHTGSLSDPSLLPALQAAAALLPPHDDDERYPNMAPSYLRTALKVQEEGEDWVLAEMKRYEEALAASLEEEQKEGGGGLDPDEKDDLRLAFNVSKLRD